MDFDKLFKELKEEILAEATSQYGALGKDVISDMEGYLAHSKEKLKKWALLFAEGKIDKDELAWLLQSQKDILILLSLEKAGVSKISLGHFKNKVINVVLTKLVLLVS